jgi:hypothetical protein
MLLKLKTRRGSPQHVMTHYLRNTSGGWQVCESAGNDLLDEFFEVARSYAESEHGGDEPEAHPGQSSLKQGFSKFFERFDDEQLEALAAACGKLSHALEEGTRQHYKRSDDSSRAAAIMQLEAAIYFIGAFDCTDGILTLPLQQLLWTLKDLDAGIVGPMAEKKPISNRAPDIVSRKATQMYAAVTMQLWMDVGSDKRPAGEAVKRPAAEAVAKILGQAGITLKRTRGDDKIIGWKTVADWRDQVQTKIKQEPDSAFALTYKRILKEGREWLGYLRRNQVDNQEIRKRALDSLALFLAQHGESYDPKVIDWEPDPSE